MIDITPINSGKYWDTRFVENWESFDGPSQSRFFAQIAIENLPPWLFNQLKSKSLKLADWGCAQGDGTNVWVNYIDVKQLTGVDFSSVAIEQAAECYPSIRFTNENWLTKNEGQREFFDIVFSSNTLEHFHNPYDVLRELSKRAKKAVILALPYRELDRIDEHFFSFLPENVPIVLSNGFRLIWSRVVDCHSLPNSLWGGEQIILLYADSNWIDGLGLTLCDITIEQTSILKPDNEQILAERASAVAERDNAIALVNLMKQSVSWRLTRPLRFAARFLRYGLSTEDRQRIMQSLRHRYHRLPLPTTIKSLFRFVYHRALLKVVHLLNRNMFQVAKFHPPSNMLNPQIKGWADYIVWGVIDWHFRHQRPQQLAVALAKTGRRVFYISPNFLENEQPGFDAERLDTANFLFQIRLFVKKAPVIYSSAPEREDVSQMRASIAEVLAWAQCKEIVSLVDHPFWLDVAAILPNSRLVYDCMDYHEGFGNNAESLLQLEKRLLNEADLTVTTSSWLDEAIAPHTKCRALIRNACDYVHFAKIPDRIYRDPHGRRVIGYYGAIAEWFDVDLIEAVAKQHPDCSVLLIGADTINARSQLAKLPNVKFTGEVPYSQLPYYLHGFDVCLLPFKIVPLTLATNPVKAYEYLSAGKAMVTVDLPEMAQFDGLVYATADKDTFLGAVSKVLSQPEPDSLLQKRKAFAQEQTWQHRADVFIQKAESSIHDPKISVVVVTYNNLNFTRACLESLDEHSQYEHMEIIVVDNASSDGTSVFLSEWVTNGSNRVLILNDDNRGFAAANNQGLEIATGDYLVLLNNDTYVTPGWARTLVRHLQRDKTIGLIGPVTNNIGNEAKIDIAYADMNEMLLKSFIYTRRHIGHTFSLRTAAFFCVMLPRSTYLRVGGLDEIFGLGFFEDDDYCRRIEQANLRIVCAEDVFIHHHLSASFNKLKQYDRQKLFEMNKKLYEAKWGEWMAHNFRK